MFEFAAYSAILSFLLLIILPTLAYLVMRAGTFGFYSGRLCFWENVLPNVKKEGTNGDQESTQA